MGETPQPPEHVKPLKSALAILSSAFKHYTTISLRSSTRITVKTPPRPKSLTQLVKKGRR